MSYAATSIARILDQVNRTIFLPAIQRPYVWEPDQIIALFDSIMKGYPISTFLFWEVESGHRGDWDIYKFIENFRHGDTHNELLEPGGRQITLVLDGQQRLTSLLIGLRGTYTVRRKYGRKGNPDSWVRQKLYIDLMKSSAIVEDNDDTDLGVTYGFRFFEQEPRVDTDHFWLKVSRILDCTSDNEFETLADQIVESLPGDITRTDRRIVEKNLERLYRVIWKDEIISFFTEMDQSLDRVLDIFIRANDGGTKLSKSDLLLSMITSKWRGVSAREEIFDLVDFLNDGLSLRNSLTKDFVMKSCLVLTDLDVQYKVGNFTSYNLSIIEKNWGKIKDTLEKTLRLVNGFGIDKETLTSSNVLIPVAYYLFQSHRSFTGSTPFEVQNAARVHRFLLGALLNATFGGSSDQTIQAARGIIREALRLDRDFPLQELEIGLARKGRNISFRDNLSLHLETRYGQKNCFLTLSLLYDYHLWGTVGHHVDHIIPKSLANRQTLMGKNVPESRIAEILECVDRVGNLQLLLGRENLEKSNEPFSNWIESRDSGFLQRHLIPDDPDLWSVERLPEFVRARETLISERLRRVDWELASAAIVN